MSSDRDEEKRILNAFQKHIQQQNLRYRMANIRRAQTLDRWKRRSDAMLMGGLYDGIDKEAARVSAGAVVLEVEAKLRRKFGDISDDEH